MKTALLSERALQWKSPLRLLQSWSRVLSRLHDVRLRGEVGDLGLECREVLLDRGNRILQVFFGRQRRNYCRDDGDSSPYVRNCRFVDSRARVPVSTSIVYNGSHKMPVIEKGAPPSSWEHLSFQTCVFPRGFGAWLIVYARSTACQQCAREAMSLLE